MYFLKHDVFCEYCQAYFAKADSSGDDKVTFDEYMSSMSSIPPQMHRSEPFTFKVEPLTKRTRP